METFLRTLTGSRPSASKGASAPTSNRPDGAKAGGPEFAKVLAQVRSAQNAHSRVAAVEELTKFAHFFDISREVDEVWDVVRTLLDDVDERTRRCGWRLVAGVIDGGGLEQLGRLRRTFLHALSHYQYRHADLAILFEVLFLLTKDGHDLAGVEGEVASLVHEWMAEYIEHLKGLKPTSKVPRTQDLSSAVVSQAQRPIGSRPSGPPVLVVTAERVAPVKGNVSTKVPTSTKLPLADHSPRLPWNELPVLVAFAVRVFEAGSGGMVAELEAQLLENVAALCGLSLDAQTRAGVAGQAHHLDQTAHEALSAIDAAIRHFFSFQATIRLCTGALCAAVSSEALFERAWGSVRRLLQGPYAHAVTQTLTDFAVSSEGSDPPETCRGAVFCLAMASWGSQHVPGLHVSRLYVLETFLEVSGRRWDLVDYEMLLGLHRLVQKHITQLSATEWHVIVEVLAKLKKHMSPPSVDTPVQGDQQVVMETGSDHPTSIQLYSSLLVMIQAQADQPESMAGHAGRFMDLVLELCGIGGAWTSPVDYHQFSASYISLHPGYVADPLPTFSPTASRKLLSPSTIIRLLDYIAASHRIYPANAEWLSFATALAQSLYVAETRPVVRLRVARLLLDICPTLRDKDRTSLLQNVILGIMYDRLHEERDEDLIALLLGFARLVIWEETPDMEASVQKTLWALRRCARSESAPAAPECARMCSQVLASCLEGSLSESWASTAFSALVDIASPGQGRNLKARELALVSLLALRADSSWRLWLDGELGKISLTKPSKQDLGVLSELAGEKGESEVVAELFISPVVCFHSLESMEDSVPQLGDSTSVHASKGGDDDASSVSGNSAAEGFQMANEDDIVVQMDPLVDLYFEILKSETEYDVYSAVLDGLPSQLACPRLFEHSRSSLQRLRALLCDSILDDQLAPNLSLPRHLRKADLYVRAYRVLLGLVPYWKGCFTKQDQDAMVSAFQLGLHKWTPAARPCAQALLVCLYELPMSMTKHLPSILHRMSQIMSTAAISVHLLEFLAALIKTPNLWANFVEIDYRRIFAIALQYIQHAASAATSSVIPSSAAFIPRAMDQQPQQPHKEAQAGQIQPSLAAQNALGQYVIFLAYHVITLWFSSLRLAERRRHVPTILRSLALANGGTRPLDERIEVCVDMLMRFTYSNAHPKPQKSLVNQILFDEAKPGQVSSRTWLQGNSLITVKVLRSSGWAEISIRRPSGTTVLLTRLENRMRGDDIDLVSLAAPIMLGIEGHIPTPARSTISTAETSQDPKSASGDLTIPSRSDRDAEHASPLADGHQDAISVPDMSPQIDVVEIGEAGHHVYTPSVNRGSQGDESLWTDVRKMLVTEPILRTGPESTSGYIATRKEEYQVCEPGFIFSNFVVYPDYGHRDDQVRLLPDDDVTNRALSVMDRIPITDFIKVGVVYVGPGQTSEAEILANCGGSTAYHDFLANLGKFVRLKDCRDIYTGGLDTTMDLDGEFAIFWDEGRGQVIFHCTTLMPKAEHDPNCTAKKRHIGNDYVLIVWNEAGREFEFRTIPGQFNFINILVEPTDSRPGHRTDHARRPSENVYYKVTAQRREDMPEFGPVSDSKLVSASGLPAFIRHLAATADVFSQLFYNQGSGAAPVEWVSNWRERLRAIKRVRDRPQLGNAGTAAKQGSASNLAPTPVGPASASVAMAGTTPAATHVSQQVEQLDVVLDFTRFA